MKYQVVDYYDVWTNEEGQYEVNDIARTDIIIDIDDDTTKEMIIEKLKSVGYLSDNANVSNVDIDCSDFDFVIELSEPDNNDCPICRLENIER